MNAPGDFLRPSEQWFRGEFESQVQHILNDVRLNAGDIRDLRYLFNDLEVALQSMGPGLQILPFGSVVTGLGIKTSDVDCFVDLPYVNRSPQQKVIQARNILRKYFNVFTNLFAITTAKVPIVKFLHIPTNCNCDINFKSPGGVQNSQLISCLLRMDRSDRALQLAILIKYWSKVHNITGTNMLVSYALTLMVIFYLQLMNILPSVFEMQANVPPYMVDNWNMAFDRNMVRIGPTNRSSLYDLMGGFFKYYGVLNFEGNIISPYMGCLLNKKLFKSPTDIPQELALYKENVMRNLCRPLKIDSPLCVQDPFEHCRNSSVSVHPKLASRLKAHIQFAARKFEELPKKSFLRAIFIEDPNNRIPFKTNGYQKPQLTNKITKQRVNLKNRDKKNKVNLVRAFEQISGKKVSRK